MEHQFLQSREEIEVWLQKFNIVNYTIDDDLVVDVDSVVNISFVSLKYIPVQFDIVSGNFYCSNNELLSLKGAAGHKFYLSENNVWLADHVPAKFLKIKTA